MSSIEACCCEEIEHKTGASNHTNCRRRGVLLECQAYTVAGSPQFTSIHHDQQGFLDTFLGITKPQNPKWSRVVPGSPGSWPASGHDDRYQPGPPIPWLRWAPKAVALVMDALPFILPEVWTEWRYFRPTSRLYSKVLMCKGVRVTSCGENRIESR